LASWNSYEIFVRCCTERDRLRCEMSTVINEVSSRTYARLGQSGALFGMGIFDAMEILGNIFVLTADMGKPAGMGRFKTRCPNYFINVGIAEQNLIGMAAGIASEGHSVVASAQAAFISMRSFEQVRQYMGYMNAPIVTVGVNAGFGLTFFGNTHYAIEDLALLRTVPGISVISPSDAGQAVKAIVAALTSKSPVYIRCTGGLNTLPVHKSDYEFKIGKAIEVKSGADVVIFATGAVTANALEAANKLEKHGISTAVIDFHTIKPLDTDCISRYVGSKLFVSVEEHNVVGGLGGAIAEHLVSLDVRTRLLCLGIQDRFFVPGDYSYLIQQSRLDPDSIHDDILSALS
jgi:transketolase